MAKEPREQRNPQIMLPMLATVLCGVLLLVAIFLPYLVPMENLNELYEGIGMEENSLYNLARQTWEEGEPEFTYVLVIYAVFSALALLLAALKKPIGVMIFDILAMAPAVLTHAVYASNRMVRNGYFAFAIGDRLIFIAGVCLFASAIWLLIAKRKIKKARKNKDWQPTEDV